jgi:hypothetical protein
MQDVEAAQQGSMHEAGLENQAHAVPASTLRAAAALFASLVKLSIKVSIFSPRDATAWTNF